MKEEEHAPLSANGKLMETTGGETVSARQS